jgi:hypothetical protein
LKQPSPPVDLDCPFLSLTLANLAAMSASSAGTCSEGNVLVTNLTRVLLDVLISCEQRRNIKTF